MEIVLERWLALGVRFLALLGTMATLYGFDGLKITTPGMIMVWRLMIFPFVSPRLKQSPKPPLGMPESVCHWVCCSRLSGSYVNNNSVRNPNPERIKAIRVFFF